MRHIVLDPGHGGARPDGQPGIDRGVICAGVRESEVALAYSAELARALKLRGIATTQTRAGDNLALTLRDRAACANRLGVPAFVSVHCNASGSTSARGFQVFYARKSEGGRSLAHSILSHVVPGVCSGSDRTGIFPDQSIHCGYTTAAQQYADSLVGEKVDQRVRERFGPYNAYRSLAVLRRTAMPAVLLELDFLSCPAARELLLSEAYRERLCQAVAAGIDAWRT